MIGKKQKNRDRRDFLKSGLRIGVLGLFGFTGAVLIRRDSSGESWPCQIKLPCDDCRIIGKCEKPAAINFRKIKKNLTGLTG